MIKRECRSCEWSTRNALKPVLSLGLSPLANNLLESSDQPCEMFPLEVMYCPTCHNCQLSYVVPPEKMFDNYLYVSSTTKSFREHFEKAAELYIKEFNLGHDSLVVDIGSNDGIALKPFHDKGIQVIGIEPAKNIVKIADEKGIDTINDYFTEQVAEFIVGAKGKADIVLASNVFAHSDGLIEIADNAFNILKTGGSLIVEVQYIKDTLKDLTFDNIYHEHVNYWSVISINNFFSNLGYYVYKVEHIPTHGGSIRVYVKKEGTEQLNSGMFSAGEFSYIPVIEPSVNEFIQSEIAFGLNKYETYKQFADKVELIKSNTRKNLRTFKEYGLKLVGYGAPAKATTALNYFGITTAEIDYIVEDNSLKWNKFVPGVRIPIYSKDKLVSEPDLSSVVVIVMAWNFIDEIKKNNQDLIDKGVKFFSIKDFGSNYEG
jgi:SAM-dependent methyltransferase